MHVLLDVGHREKKLRALCPTEFNIPYHVHDFTSSIIAVSESEDQIRDSKFMEGTVSHAFSTTRAPTRLGRQGAQP